MASDKELYLETKIRFSCILAREICATWCNEAQLSLCVTKQHQETSKIHQSNHSQAKVEEKSDGKPSLNEVVSLPPRLVLTAISLIRQIGKARQGNFQCNYLSEVCTWIASKICETRLRLKDVANSGRMVEMRRCGMVKDTLNDRCEKLLMLEMECLAICGFVVTRMDEERPHRFLLVLIETILPQQVQEDVMKSAWAYLNDAVMLELDQIKPLDVACAALALAAQDLNTELPSEPIPWFKAVGADQQVLESVAFRIYELINQWDAPQWMD